MSEAMNKQAALDRLTALESEAAALRKIIEAPEVKGLWRPNDGDEMFYAQRDGTVSHHHSVGLRGGSLAAFGNCFPSEEIAKKAAERIAFCNKVIAACLQADECAGPMRTGMEWAPYYDLQSKKWNFTSFNNNASQPCFVHTKEQAEEAARILNAEGVQP